MNTQELQFLIPPYGTATLRLPGLLSVQRFERLQAAVSAALADAPPRGETVPVGDPGELEFASWRLQRR